MKYDVERCRWKAKGRHDDRQMMDQRERKTSSEGGDMNGRDMDG